MYEINILKIIAFQVKIRLKQSEVSCGPKVAIEMNLGSLILFLSPRQFHILMELVDGFSCPDLEDNRYSCIIVDLLQYFKLIYIWFFSNVFHKNQPQVRPMTEKDYERVEEQLANMTKNRNFQAFNLLQGQGWSTGSMGE